MSDDLWPADIGQTDLKPPVAILREQASFLSKATGGLVQADVKTAVIGDEIFHNTFTLVVEALDYRYDLFEVRHRVSFYPLDILPRAGHKLDNTMDVDGEERFVAALKSLLGTPEIKSLIHSLLAQARAAQPSDA